MTWYLIAGIFLVGLWGVIAIPNLVRKVVGLTFMNTAIILFFVTYGAQGGTNAPIITDSTVRMSELADPLPQALMLTAIVVGICVVAVALVIVHELYKRFGTLDIRELERRAWGSEPSHD